MGGEIENSKTLLAPDSDKESDGVCHDADQRAADDQVVYPGGLVSVAGQAQEAARLEQVVRGKPELYRWQVGVEAGGDHQGLQVGTGMFCDLREREGLAMIADLEVIAGALLQSKDGKFMVYMRGFALHFHKNLNGRQYSVVKDSEATRFDTPEEARAAIRVWNVPAKYAEVVAVGQAGPVGPEEGTGE